MLIAQVLAPLTPSSEAVPLTSPLMLTLISGLIVTIISAIVTGIVTVITALRVSSMNNQQASNTNTILSVAKDTATIKGHVNGDRTAIEGKLSAATAENALLRSMLADQKLTAALLAQATAQSSRVAAISPVTVVSPAAAIAPTAISRRSTDMAPVPTVIAPAMVVPAAPAPAPASAQE